MTTEDKVYDELNASLFSAVNQTGLATDRVLAELASVVVKTHILRTVKELQWPPTEEHVDAAIAGFNEYMGAYRAGLLGLAPPAGAAN